ncbi:hypothetical protein CYMTET_46331 [Cymbomonas tetramitiformis]|uniref:HAT C-terminal dimerisation domain-containing protein n=1 Tax=Cymbomonas tetramitiformis TaxID=36881 RepID=A0AAE0EX61_9CHLO|nr:hypothetical protein CYMTET_46331 [Cymbomonas tetramitiformis]
MASTSAEEVAFEEFALFQEDAQEVSRDDQIKQFALEEIAKFQKLKISQARDKEFSVLDWWAQCGGQFPSLRMLAQIIFSIPGSEIENERVFSIAGCVASIKRNSVRSENLDMIVHINQNHPNDPLIGMQTTKGRVDSLKEVEVAEEDMADHFEDLLIENEMVDAQMAETFEE